MGRPLYWKSSVESTEDQEEEVAAEAMECDGMEEDDFEEDDDEEEEVQMDNDEAEEDDTWLDCATFRRMVDVINRSNISVEDDSYSCLQATTEDFLTNLVQASARSSHFAGRKEITEQDVRFAQMMTQQKW